MVEVEDVEVSIHAPAGGATSVANIAFSYFKGFNPRARGGRDGVPISMGMAKVVSIHAPAGGATI